MTEKLSALLDGHLDDDTATRSIFDTLRQDRVMREKWGTYCLIGDALRGQAQGAPDLANRVLARLDAEPTVLAPALRPRASARSTRLGRVVLPVAASVMGVTAVGWVVQSMQSPTGSLEVAAKTTGKASGMVAAAAAPVANPEDPLRSYVFAHQALAGGSPIPGVAQFVRTVTEVGQGSDR
jgi:sigma-E factor negative regulatory protein RseA